MQQKAFSTSESLIPPSQFAPRRKPSKESTVPSIVAPSESVYSRTPPGGPQTAVNPISETPVFVELTQAEEPDLPDTANYQESAKNDDLSAEEQKSLNSVTDAHTASDGKDGNDGAE